MHLARASIVLSVLVACARGQYATVDPGHPAFVVPHHVAEGKGEGSDLPPDADGGTRQPLPPPVPEPAPPSLSGSAPDPDPLMMAEQWQYQLLFQNGAPSVEHVEKRTLAKPVSTPRRMGRFALELWIGRELIDRVRFDFPLIAAEEAPGITRRPLHDAPSLAPNAVARIRVSLPASPRATRLVLVDRATEKIQELPWPPDRQPSAPTPSVSASAPPPPLPSASATTPSAPTPRAPKTPAGK
ncbi:MAG TPA: hypothetical protein VJV79_40015 [Polyangiaceae bacterium]|nr:hypothetical protein [Polyangiaceae bacterium]